MGWEPGKPVGLNSTTVVEPFEFLKRHHRGGIGSDIPDFLLPTKKKFVKPGESRDPKPQMRVPDGKIKHRRNLDDELIEAAPKTLKKDVLVKIAHGRHKGLEGRYVSEVNDTHCRVLLAKSGECVDVRVTDVKIIDEAQRIYDQKHKKKYGLITSDKRGENDEIDNRKHKEDTPKRESEDSETSSQNGKRRDKSESSDRGSDSDRGRRKQREKEVEEEEYKYHKSSKENSNENPSKKMKVHHSESEKEKGEAMQDDDNDEENSLNIPRGWLCSNIRVRMVSKKLKKGTVYMKKGVVVDVLAPGLASVQMDDGVFCEAVEERDLQTALPKTGGSVIILKGNHKGKRAKLLEKESQSNRGVVQLTDDFQHVICALDDIAEAV
jgi:hypothetical protein